MAENDKKSAGADISKGLRKMSEAEWDKAMQYAEASEENRTRWMADAMKDEADKKKVETGGGPKSEPAGP